MGSVTFGLQMGGSGGNNAQIIMMVMSQKAIDSLIKGRKKFEPL